MKEKKLWFQRDQISVFLLYLLELKKYLNLHIVFVIQFLKDFKLKYSITIIEKFVN